MAWILMLVPILGIIFTLYISNSNEKLSKLKQNNTGKIKLMDKDLIEKIYDIRYFTLPYNKEELQKINRVKHELKSNYSLSVEPYRSFYNSFYNLLEKLQSSSYKMKGYLETIDSLQKDEVSNYIKLTENDTKQKSTKQLVHKKGVVRVDFDQKYPICILGTEKDVKKWVQDNHPICVQQVSSLLKSGFKFDPKNKMYECFQNNFSLEAIKYKIINATLDPKNIIEFKQVLDPDESDNYEASDSKKCNEDSFVINIGASQLEKELINTVRRFTKKSDNSKRGK